MFLHLQVYDSSYSMAQYKIGSYCGNDIPGPFISTGSNLFMIFKSDPEFTAEGFQGDVVFNELLGKQFKHLKSKYGDRQAHVTE